MKTIVIKLGGSVLTEKKDYKKANKKMISQLAREISKINNKYKIILVHGAGSFGHAPVVKYKINNGIKTKKHKLGFADTHLSVSQLSNMIVEALIFHGVSAVSLTPTLLFKQNNKKVCSFNDKIVKDFLDAGYLPILYGDMVLDKKLNGSVLSGDQIMKLVSKKMKADKMVFISDVEGVYVDGKVFPKITKSNLSSIKSHLGGSAKVDVTGGMYGKLMEIMKSKVSSVITNPQNLAKAVQGKKVGTSILP
ncbi:isopentenyl phosphate kinase family protein [Candidatus Micrarchaeota archaeon]|nr:isopentenyl phosphate kinase family protein [Candidatus Micrarchaeota archaeon]